MLRYRRLLVGAIVMAVVAGAGLGASLIAVAPVLENILGGGQSLAEIFREKLPAGLVPPESWLQRLPESPYAAILWIVVTLGVVTVVSEAARFLHAYFALTVVHRTVARIRLEAFRCVVKLPLRSVVHDGTSDTVSRIINDTNRLSEGFNALLSKGVISIAKGAGALVAALVIDWRLTLIALIVAPVLYAVIRKLGKRIRRASRAALDSQAEMLGLTTQAMQSLRVVKVYGTERFEARRFHKTNTRVMRELLRVRTARALASPVVEILSIFALGFLSVVAAKAILDGHLETDAFILTIVSLAVAGESLRPLTGIVNDVQQSAAASDRISQLLDSEPEAGHEADLPKLPRHSASLSFDNVSMTYPGAARPALDGISLDVKFGETIAVVGPNGCGKTSLLSLVPRLFDPQAGRVLVDGKDVREFEVRSLRNQIGVVTQETVLFADTIAANIGYGTSRPDIASIREAAEKARAIDFIERLPQGFDSDVGEQGLTLSGGQRQRISIARAILRDPAILILDEATSMIDAESEAMIAQALGEFSRGRTTLVVAHRLSTVRRADRIVVMDAGKVVDQGTHEELLGRCDVYRKLARTQLGGDEEGSISDA